MRTNKTLYGLMAIGPIALIIVSFLVIFASMSSVGMLEDGRMEERTAILFIGFAGLIVLASLFSVVGLIMFIIHASKNKLIPEDQRLYWILGMVMASGIANILYFFMYIMREDELLAAQQNDQTKSPWD